MIDFTITETQKMIIESLENNFSKKTDIRLLNEKAEGDNEYKYGYEEVSKLGFLGMITSEELDGFGLDFVDFSIFMEKWGSFLCNGPIINNIVSGIFALQSIDEKRFSKLIKDLSISKRIITSSIAQQYESKEFIQIINKDQSFFLNGSITNIEFFDEATDITIIGMLDNQLKLLILPKKNISISQEKKSLIGDKIVDLKLSDHLIEKDLIVDLNNSEKLIEQIFNLTNLALCSESIGICQSILDKTLDYLINRDAFGKKIGTFQSIQHKCAEIYIYINEVRELIRNAFKNINNEDFSRLASMSKIKSDLELDKITWISHQLHGAIGFTWDYGLHLYTKKILINKSLGGDLNFHSTKLYPDGN